MAAAEGTVGYLFAQQSHGVYYARLRRKGTWLAGTRSSLPPAALGPRCWTDSTAIASCINLDWRASSHTASLYPSGMSFPERMRYLLKTSSGATSYCGPDISAASHSNAALALTLLVAHVLLTGHGSLSARPNNQSLPDQLCSAPASDIRLSTHSIVTAAPGAPDGGTMRKPPSLRFQKPGRANRDRTCLLNSA